MPKYVFIAVSLSVLTIAFAWGQIDEPGPQLTPIASGTVMSGTIWNKPVGSSGPNLSFPIPEGSRVEVYNNFIIVTYSKGVSEILSHGWYSSLKFNKD
jgi:hypothetical protein